MKSILLIEDDQSIADLLQLYLTEEGYRVVHLLDATSFEDIFSDQKFCFVVLDWMLPGLSGIDILKLIRKKSDVPVMLLTARGAEIDKVLSFELGVDDYVTKPFSPREVVARVKAILRRNNDDKILGDFTVQDLKISKEEMLVLQEDKVVEFSSKEFEILLLLASNPNKVFSRMEILEKVYGSASGVFDRTIDAHIKKIRKKLGDDPKIPKYIKSVFGAGYKFLKNE